MPARPPTGRLRTDRCSATGLALLSGCELSRAMFADAPPSWTADQYTGEELLSLRSRLRTSSA